MIYAAVVESADTLAWGASDCKIVQVQVLSAAPNAHNPNHIFPVGDGFGFVLSIEYPNFNRKNKK